eukprot:jgi/Ulvmu1/12844/UM098_0029.1
MASTATFESLGLDYRVLRSIEKKSLRSPTDVQTAVIGKALEGKDIVARAHTGSGKTLAYLAPAIHSVLQQDSPSASFQVIVLVPTSELCQQVRKEATSIAVHCGANLRATVLSGDAKQKTKHISVASSGQIVVATPGRLAAVLKDEILPTATLTAHLKVLVLDEADLLLSYGYEQDLQALQPLVPRSAQCMLMSATTSSDVDRLAALMLHNACFLDLSASTSSTPTSAPAITHTFTRIVAAQDRLLTVLALLRLNLIKKKVLLFVNSPEAAYRVRLLLEAFGMRAGTLVGTLPLASRHNAIEQFNAGAFDILVASEAPKASQAAHGSSGKDAAESGVTRGIDFKGVRTVVNVEVPADVTAYTHRVGRTGRAAAEGLAITIVGPGDETFLETLQAAMPARAGEDGAGGLQPFGRLKADAVNALRYRGQDVLRGLTKKAVQDARSRDLKLEVMNCTKLQEFFESHQADAVALQNDKQLTKHSHTLKHLRHLPDYLKKAAGVGGHVSDRSRHRRTIKRKLRPEDDPLKKRVVFNKEEEPTEVEIAAQKVAKKVARKQAKAEVPIYRKQNVRKRR